MTQTADSSRKQPDEDLMSEGDFAKLSDIIRSECGISLTPAKKVMLTVRLIKRVKALEMDSISQYVRFVDSPTGKAEELEHMIDAVSTNKTEFFREAEHFDYLAKVAAPMLERESPRCRRDGIHAWSAGCASGEEAYTLAMVFSEYREAKPGFRFQIMATDISGNVLEEAVRAVYTEREVQAVPVGIRRKYLLKGKGDQSGCYRVAPELRRLVSFRRHNLSDRDFGLKEAVDVIFCRNVIIYLDRKVQENLFHNFHKSMSKGGYLFVGHSETLDGLSDEFTRVAPTIYRRL